MITFRSHDGHEVGVLLPDDIEHTIDIMNESGISIVIITVDGAEIVLNGFTPGDLDGFEAEEEDEA